MISETLNCSLLLFIIYFFILIADDEHYQPDSSTDIMIPFTVLLSCTPNVYLQVVRQKIPLIVLELDLQLRSITAFFFLSITTISSCTVKCYLYRIN